jgi:hypothetical protein
MTDDVYRYPITMCWHCDRPLDAARNIPGQEGMPEPGAVSLCFYCGAVAVFEEGNLLRPPTEDELDELRQDHEFMATFAGFSWHRQYVMIKESLMRDREDPDR